MLGSFFDFLFGKGMELFGGKIRFKISKTKLRHKLEEQGERYFKETFAHLSLSREFDYGAFTAFIGEELFGKIAQCLQTPYWEERRRKEEILLHEVYSRAQAHTPGSQKEVKACFEVVLRLVQAFLFEVEDTNARSNHIVDEVGSLLWKSESTIRQELADIREALEAKDSFRSFIDAIKPKAPSTDPFHYLCPAIQFQGREREFAALDAFLEDERPLLCSIITGSGGAGKSRLMYEYTQTRASWKWRMVFCGKSNVKKMSGFQNYEYDRNLLIVIDYAGELSDGAGQWLSSLSELSESVLPPKLRFVLLERDGMTKDKEGSPVYPAWYRNLMGSGTEKQNLERIQYQWSQESPFWELGELSDEDYGRMISDYGKAREREISERRREDIISFVKKLELEQSGLKAARPLIVLFVADAYLSRGTYRELDTTKLISEVVDRYRNHWREVLCKGNEELYNAMTLLLVYSTAVGPWNLEDELPPPFDRAAETLLNLTPMELAALCCGIGHKEVDEEVFPSLEPDIIGEFFVLDYFRNCNKRKLRKLTEALWQAPDPFMYFLFRCSNDYLMDTELRRLFYADSVLLKPQKLNNTFLSFFCSLLVSFERSFGQKEEVAQAVTLAERVKSIYECNIKNEEVVVAYAGSLVNLSAVYKDAERREEVISRLKLVYEICENNEEVAVEYAKGLFNLSNAYKDAEHREEIISRLKAVYETYENNEEVAVAYAKGLFNLMFVYEDVESREEVISRLKAVYEANENKEEVMIWYAKGLFNLFFDFIASKEKMDLDVNAFLTKNFVYRPITTIVIRFAEDFLARVEDEETKRVLAEMREALLTHLDHME